MAKSLTYQTLSAIGILASCTAASAVGRYRIIELSGFQAMSINESGEIAGWLAAGRGSTGAVWRDGTYELIGALEGGMGSTFPQAINNSGSVVGFGNVPMADGVYPFVWDGDTLPLDPIYANQTLPYHINARGDVVGSLRVGLSLRAFLWNAGQATVFGTLSGQGYSVAFATNDKGQIVGGSSIGDQIASISHGVIWDNGVINDLSFTADLDSSAYDINDLSQIVGDAEYPDGHFTATLWDWESGNVIDLGTLPSTLGSFATGINNHTQVVGMVSLGGFENWRCFFWENGLMVPLEALLLHDPGWTFTIARDINDAGQIIGQGVYKGQDRSFLLTPVAPADLDSNGVINSTDLGVLLSSWSIPATAPGCGGATPCYADINGDGVVNTIDLGMLLSSWTL